MWPKPSVAGVGTYKLYKRAAVYGGVNTFSKLSFKLSILKNCMSLWGKATKIALLPV